MSHQQCWTDTAAPEKKCSRLHLSVRLSGPWDPPQFLSQHSHWSSRLKLNICWRQATRLNGSISSVCNLYVQYLLVGGNSSVLSRHGRGCNLRGVSLPHHTSRSSQPMVLHFPPKGTARSQVIHPIIINRTTKGTKPKSREWEPPLNFYCNLSSKHSMS
jgi:hypothetical protein